MTKRVLSYVGVALLSMALTSLFQPLSYLEALAQQTQPARCQTFRETGKTVCGRFLEYWQKNGGLAQQGFPISDTFTEVSDLNGKPYLVQYFERAVFELHPEEKPPYDVLLSQLGRFRFNSKYPSGVPPVTPGAAGAITGRLGYPSEGVPPLEVFAIEVAGQRTYSVRTQQNQQTFTISGVAPGVYYVVAYWDGAPDLTGGYSQYVICGQRVDCTEHTLIPVVVASGQTAQGVRVEDWIGLPGVFPARPSGQPPAPFAYMWPRQVPQGYVIDKGRSSASATSFVLEIRQPGGGQFSGTVTGGPGSAAATVPARGTAVTVRGRQATLFTTGAGYSVFWRESGFPYAVIGGLPRDTAIALAESLEPVDLATWRQRLQAVP